MSCCCCEREDVYIKERFISPHCETCECCRSELEVRHKINRPLYSVPLRNVSCHYLPDMICCCTNKCGKGCNLCLCYECRRIRGRSEASIHKRRQCKFSKNKHSVLETWFSRFDTDRDGFLGLVELESLLKHLGVTIRNSYTKKILQTCDRDCDGRLSFPEFVRLWQRAAVHDEKFYKTTGCHDLSPIVKKYKLFPDSRHCSCHEYNCKHVTFATDHPVQPVKCNCGQREKVIPFIKHEEKKHSPKKEPSKIKDTLKQPEDPDKLPTMSMNRDNIF